MRGAGGGDDMQGERPVCHCQGIYLTQKGFPDCVVGFLFSEYLPLPETVQRWSVPASEI